MGLVARGWSPRKVERARLDAPHEPREHHPPREHTRSVPATPLRSPPPLMAPARALALLCIALCTGAAAASGRGLLATSEAVDVTAVDLPVMPELELANFTGV